jgi:hypothetical protein
MGPGWEIVILVVVAIGAVVFFVLAAPHGGLSVNSPL